MRLTIGVMGTESGAGGVETHVKLVQLGCAIAERGHILITEALPGLPYTVARGAQAAGGLSIGISPVLSQEEHVRRYHLPTDVYDVLIYTGLSGRRRAVLAMRSSDIIIIAGGLAGTLDEVAIASEHTGALDEFAIACNEGRLFGALTGTGGVADRRFELARACRKNTDAVVLCGADPARLVARLTAYYMRMRKRSRRLNGFRAASGDQMIAMRAERVEQAQSESRRERTSRRPYGGQREARNQMGRRVGAPNEATRTRLPERRDDGRLSVREAKGWDAWDAWDGDDGWDAWDGDDGWDAWDGDDKYDG
jgi:uncharacterized protein (TIGR00725 family)